jgi:hypothetical protein
MGYVRSPRLRPWEHVDGLDAVCVSYSDIRKTSSGLARALEDVRSHLCGFGGALLVDSGAFSAFRSGKVVTRQELCEFYLAVQAQDSTILLANLDVVPREPGACDPQAVAQSRENYEWLRAQGARVFPVLHVGELPELYLDDDPPFLGVGGAVPVIRKNTGKRAFFRYLLEVRRLYPGAHVHVFGAAGPTMVPALDRIPVDSGDWIGWRICASMGNIQLPSRQTNITDVKADKYCKGIRPEERWAFVEGSPWTLADLQETFDARALFNLWCWSGIAREQWPGTGGKWLQMLEQVKSEVGA